MVKTSDALKIINKMNHDDPELEDMIAQASINADVAQLIYEHRNKVGLTQKQLAELVGIQESAIKQLEDADFDGYALLMLQKIAQALNQRVVINLMSVK